MPEPLFVSLVAAAQRVLRAGIGRRDGRLLSPRPLGLRAVARGAVTDPRMRVEIRQTSVHDSDQGHPLAGVKQGRDVAVRAVGEYLRYPAR